MTHSGMLQGSGGSTFESGIVVVLSSSQAGICMFGLEGQWSLGSLSRNERILLMRFITVLYVALILGALCVHPAVSDDGSSQQAPQRTQRQQDFLYENAAVAADHPSASQAGVEILKQGGNVVDAAVATAFALSVVRPASCGIGGGGFMVIWNAEAQQAIVLDYRERAPGKASRNMFARAEESRKGPLAVAVPTQVAGLCSAVEHYGRLDIKRVLAPAIRLARDGVPADRATITAQRVALAEFNKHPKYRDRFAPLYRKYLNSGKSWKKGERIRSPQLAVLERIAEKGSDGFYRGPVADALFEVCGTGKGILTRDDLAATKPIVRKPLQTSYEGFTILTMPPPSSGGIALIETLNILSACENGSNWQRLESMGHNSPQYLHLLTEAMKHAFADRARYLGDTDFVQIPLERLTSPAYAAELAKRIDKERTKPPVSYGRFQTPDDGGTSHFSVIDAAGNAVACTETINTVFGSFVVDPEFGIVLNNEMDDFAARPGKPNAFGLIQSEANAVEPNKKPLSSMSPTILLKQGKAVYALGASGGPRIISTTLQVLLNLTRFSKDPETAIRHPRIHHQWMPNTLFVEQPLFQTIKTPLEARGHVVQLRDNLAVSQAVSRDDRRIRAASDPRRGGRPAGY